MTFPMGLHFLGAMMLAVGIAQAQETYVKTPFYENGMAVTFLTFNADGTRIAFARRDLTVSIRDIADGSEMALIAVPSMLSEGDDYIELVAFSPDGTRLATASRDRAANIFDVASGSQSASLEHSGPVVIAVFSPDSSRLATATIDGQMLLWDVETAASVASLNHPTVVHLASFSPDGARLVTVSSDDMARVWDVAAGRIVAVLDGHDALVLDARFSRDGSRIVTSSADGTARVWDAATGDELLVLRHPDPVSVADFSADGNRIVTGSAEAHVFDAGREVAVLRGHRYPVTAVGFSPDGTRVVTGADDGGVRVFDGASGELLSDVTGHSYAVTSLRFSADGERFFTIGGGQGIVWTRLAPVNVPEGIAGLWFHDFGTPEEPLPPEIVKAMCVASPIRVDDDGLIVLFDGGFDAPPIPAVHVRCTADGSCHVFSGSPTDNPEPVGVGAFSVTAESGELCLIGECRAIARCPAIAWTDDEKNSGYVDAWEAAVLARAN